MGLARGCYCFELSGPKYYLKQRKRRGGIRIGSSKELRREGEYLTLRSTAGYAKNNPEGWIGYFFCISRAWRETAKFPPAESPARIIFFALIFKYLWIFSMIN